MGDSAALTDRGTSLPRSWRAPLRARSSDEHLARAVARGHEDAFAELYRRHHQALYRYCRSILRDAEEAEDALQSAMAKAFAALRDRERDLAVRPWLFRIAHNEAITLLRRRRTQNLHAEQLAWHAAAAQSVAPEQAMEQRERLATLFADLGSLAVRQRAALLMRELSGLSIEEIACALATTQGAAKQALFEARSALRDLAEGRTVDCESIRRLIDEHDGRVLRGRVVRSHLSSCTACRELEQSIAERRADLRVLVPPLPAAAGGAILARLLAGAGASHGGAAVAGAAALGNTGAGGSGLASALGGSVATKAALGAAIVVLAAGGAVHVLSGSRHAPRTVHRGGAAHTAARARPGKASDTGGSARGLPADPAHERGSRIAGSTSKASEAGPARHGISHQSRASLSQGASRAAAQSTGNPASAHGRGHETVPNAAPHGRRGSANRDSRPVAAGHGTRSHGSHANPKSKGRQGAGAGPRSESSPAKPGSQTAGRSHREGETDSHRRGGSEASVTSSQSSSTSTTASRTAHGR
jgi:RNA polymerase sigma factor (sigma-70 family)